jgi:hypothetical protein
MIKDAAEASTMGRNWPPIFNLSEAALSKWKRQSTNESVSRTAIMPDDTADCSDAGKGPGASWPHVGAAWPASNRAPAISMDMLNRKHS